jgi:hypothetical protein
MDNLEILQKRLNTLRIGKMEDFAYNSNNPLNDILNFFKRDCKSFETGFEDEIKYTRLVMNTNIFGKPREFVTIHEIDGELFHVGIHGNTSKLRKEYNSLVKLLEDLGEEPEIYLGKIGERNGTTYFGNIYADYIYGVAKNVQITGDTLQVFVKNFYKS